MAAVGASAALAASTPIAPRAGKTRQEPPEGSAAAELSLTNDSADLCHLRGVDRFSDAIITNPKLNSTCPKAWNETEDRLGYRV